MVDTLAEVHHGDGAGCPDADIEARWPGAMQRREAQKYRWRFPGGESYADADVRASAAVTYMARSGATAPSSSPTR